MIENDLFSQHEKQSLDPNYSRYYIWNSGENIGISEEFKDTVTDAENITYVIFKSGRTIRQTMLAEMMSPISEPINTSTQNLDLIATSGLSVVDVDLDDSKSSQKIEKKNESIFSKLLSKSKRKSKVKFDFSIEVELPSIESMIILGEDFDIDVQKELKDFLLELIKKESKLTEDGINNKLNEWFNNGTE